jgi:hypothetical protein
LTYHPNYELHPEPNRRLIELESIVTGHLDPLNRRPEVRPGGQSRKIDGTRTANVIHDVRVLGHAPSAFVPIYDSLL